MMQLSCVELLLLSDRVAAAHVQAERLKAAVWVPNDPFHVPVISYPCPKPLKIKPL